MSKQFDKSHEHVVTNGFVRTFWNGRRYLVWYRSGRTAWCSLIGDWMDKAKAIDMATARIAMDNGAAGPPLMTMAKARAEHWRMVRARAKDDPDAAL